MTTLDLEAIKGRRIAAVMALNDMTLGWSDTTPSKLRVDAALADSKDLAGEVAALRERAETAEANVRAVEQLHRAVCLYQPCPDGGCDNHACEEGENAGEYHHFDEVEGMVCAECRDEDGSRVDAPCPTIKAIDP